MKKTKLLTSLAALALVLGLGACDGGDCEECLPCEDDGAGVVDGDCEGDECLEGGDANHEHTLGVWEYDDDGHWQVCLECGEIVNFGVHAYPDEYTPDDEDARYHSKVCVCGHKVKAAHQAASEAGDCLYCSVTGLNTAGLTYQEVPYEPDEEDPDYDPEYTPETEYYVSDYDMELTASELYIPATYNGGAVTYVGTFGITSYSTTGAFAGSSSHVNLLSFVSIPDSVIEINAGAFNSCYGLRTIELGSGVEAIGDYAFYQCYALETIHIPGNVKSLGDRCFQNCYALSDIQMDEGVESFGAYCFYYCYSVESLYFPDSAVNFTGRSVCVYMYHLKDVRLSEKVEVLAEYMFQYCANLETITIPASVKEIPVSCFSYCYVLESVTFEGKPDTFGTSIFNSDYSLRSFVVPDEMTEIPQSTFSSCYKLEELFIPSTVTTIATQATQNCHALSRVYYDGTADDWNEINYTSSTNKISDLNLYYRSDEEPTEEGLYWHYDDNGNYAIW